MIEYLQVGTTTYRIYNPPAPSKYVGWRCLHKAENGNDNTPNEMPEVTPPLYGVGLDMTDSIQQMSYDLMLYFNKAIQTPDWNPKKIWTNIHDHDRAFTNGQGFNNDGDPRRNYILKENLDSPFPKYDKQGRLCGGAFIRGLAEVDSLGREIIRCKPGVHGIDATKPLPSIQTIVNNNWYFFAINYFPTHVEHFAQGQGQPIAIPFIFDRDVKFERKFFEVWESDVLPNPLKIYNV